jgi:hypothetical protein
MTCAVQSRRPARSAASLNHAPVCTAPEGDEGQLLRPPLGAGGERLAERREDRQIDESASLLIPKLDRAILLNVLAA